MHYMIDLETAGTQPSSVILTVGIVGFDRSGIKEQFYARLAIDEQLDRGRTEDPQTLEWWSDQSEEAKEEAWNGERQEVAEVLTSIERFFAGKYVNGVWGNGATFDNVLYESLCSTYETELPWHWASNRCYRTAVAMLDPNKERRPVNPGVAHNALDDAMIQAEHFIRIASFYPEVL